MGRRIAPKREREGLSVPLRPPPLLGGIGPWVASPQGSGKKCNSSYLMIVRVIEFLQSLDPIPLPSLPPAVLSCPVLSYR